MDPCNEIQRRLADALCDHDPAALGLLFQSLQTRESAQELAENLDGFKVPREHYDVVMEWVLHPDRVIAKGARSLVVLLRDTALHTEVFTGLALADLSEPPIKVSYNHAEREFSVDAAELVGFCVGHRGSEDPQVDRLLHALERYYSAYYGLTPGTSHFRQ